MTKQAPPSISTIAPSGTVLKFFIVAGLGPAALHALTMKYLIDALDGSGAIRGGAIYYRPGSQEFVVLLSTTRCTRPVTGGERRRLVKKEQRCVMMGLHKRPLWRVGLPNKCATHPSLAVVVTCDDLLIVMQDPAVAHQVSVGRSTDDCSKGRDAIA